MVDDKLRILTAMKKRMGARLLTVFPRQGHYAHDLKTVRLLPPADITVEHIGDLLGIDVPARLRALGAEETTQEGTS
jgi:hypothetical protein